MWRMAVVNDRLRVSLVRSGVQRDELAECCGVDPKTVDRWISDSGRVPHPRYRWAAAQRLGVDESFLWPAVLARRPDSGMGELVELFRDRASIPRETWLQVMSGASASIDVLVMSGTFYSQVQPRISQALAARAEAGAHVRLCFGDPASEAVAIRDREERIGGTLAHKIRSSLCYYRDLVDIDGVEIRLHSTTLYASLFRYDDDLLANPHAYGEPASANPVMYLRRGGPGGVVDHWMSSFERVWESSRLWTGEI